MTSSHLFNGHLPGDGLERFLATTELKPSSDVGIVGEGDRPQSLRIKKSYCNLRANMVQIFSLIVKICLPL